MRLLRLVPVAGLALLSVACFAAEFAGRVVGVLDGDTVDVLTPAKQTVRVRLAGIDAPEKGQPFGNVAKSRLSDLVYGRDVTVDWHKRDRYGRLVGKVLVKGSDADLEMLKSGLAWHYVKYAREQSPTDRNLYAQAEARAREQRVGLWRDRNPQAPWDYRRPTVRSSLVPRGRGYRFTEQL